MLEPREFKGEVKVLVRRNGVTDFPAVGHTLKGFPMAFGPAGGHELSGRKTTPFRFGHPPVPNGLGLRPNQNQVAKPFKPASTAAVEQFVVMPSTGEPTGEGQVRGGRGSGVGFGHEGGKFAMEQAQPFILAVESAI